MLFRLPPAARLLLAASFALGALGSASLVAGAPRADAEESALFLPLALRAFSGPFPTVDAQETPVPVPSATASVPATAEPTSATPARTATTPPTPTLEATPTSPGAEVRFPRNPDTIILQIGRTDTTQSSQVFEEMNGTPWFTLYGDGRVIAGRAIFDNRQPLLLGHADEARMQRWLRTLVHAAGFYALKSTYHHPRLSTPEVHVYVYTNDGAKRVSLRSFKQFEQWGVPEDIPESASITALIAFVRGLESELVAVPDAESTPFAPDCYTVLAQQMYGFEHMADQFETWEHGINVRTVAEAAPTAASNYEGKVVGHKFVDGALGREIRDAVLPQWEHWFPDENMAAAFRIGRLPYAVGARQEVPGGSLFLPNEGFDTRGSFWYRRDPGSGGCPGIPRRYAPAPPGLAERIAHWLGMPPQTSRWAGAGG